MLLIAGKAPGPETARAMAAETLKDGSAWRVFREFVAAQGGDLAVVDDPTLLPAAPLVEPLLAERGGYLAEIDAREVGYAVVELGGGRERKGDPVDPAVGVVLAEGAKVGNPVRAGDPLMWIHARNAESLAAAKSRLQAAVRVTDGPVEPPPLIYTTIRSDPA